MIKSALVASQVVLCCQATAQNPNLPHSVLAYAALDQTAPHHSIEHISIYANRTATMQQDVLSSVTVLQREDIIARQASDLPGLLAQLPGINLARDGGRGQSSGVYVRGGNTGHTLVLIDGVRAGSATLGYKSLSLLPLEMIERIEVVRGPAASRYGSDALAGVIAITTRRTDTVELNANVGSFAQRAADLSVGYQASQLILHATAGVSRADGFNVRQDLDADRDGYRQQFFKLAAEYQTALGRWRAQADVNSGYYEFDASYGTELATDSLNRTYLLQWQHDVGQWQHQAQLSRSLDHEASFGPDSRSPFVTERDEFNYQTVTNITAAVQFLAGGNWYHEQVDKSVVAYQQTSRLNQALFSGLHYMQGPIRLEATARRDVADQFGGQNTWQLAAGYQLASHWRLRLSRGTAFKSPTFNELYYPGFANPELRPEQSVSDEIAVSYHTTDITAQLAWFDRDVTNLIHGVERAENVVLATISGVEFSLQQRWQQFNSSFGYTWLDTENRSTGRQLERRPQHSVNWRGSYSADNWSLFITTDYQSATYQGVYASVANLAGFTVWGAGASYQLAANWMLSAKLDNVFNKHYQTSASYSTAGTNFGLSIRYSAF